MSTTATEHVLDLHNPGVCRGQLKHVFRTETRIHKPSTTLPPKARDALAGMVDNRTICQRCRGVLLDWDGPFTAKILTVENG